tara:strand:+ start:152 stop:400 length:249 start_codon:yes stop_codon:yes gene_type:complete
MQESTALIKLTKSEIESVIVALGFVQQTAETFGVGDHIYWKLKHDFIQIQQDIIDGEKQNETKNKMEEETQRNRQACEPCDD